MAKKESKNEGWIKRLDPDDPEAERLYEMLGWKKDGKWIIKRER